MTKITNDLQILVFHKLFWAIIHQQFIFSYILKNTHFCVCRIPHEVIIIFAHPLSSKLC